MKARTSSLSRSRINKKQAIFSDRVYDVVRSIPKGSVLAYGAVAALAGSPLASRVVGSLMKRNFDPAIPCHRVICADGTVGQYNRGIEEKRALLKGEGVVIAGEKVVV